MRCRHCRYMWGINEMQGSPFRVYRLYTFNVIDICAYKILWCFQVRTRLDKILRDFCQNHTNLFNLVRMGPYLGLVLV